MKNRGGKGQDKWIASLGALVLVLSLGACDEAPSECSNDFGCGVGQVCSGGLCQLNLAADRDNDGAFDAEDNCFDLPNVGQEDTDADGQGNVCDADIDNDGVLDDGDGSLVLGDSHCIGASIPYCDDGCPIVPDPNVLNCDDNCPLISNPNQQDLDEDSTGDHCDPLIALAGWDLDGLSFHRAFLEGADLQGASLQDAFLRSAQLFSANLAGANLSDAFLESANLTQANLSGANLTGVTLFDAILDKANLTNANLTRASFEQANLTNADLTGANLSNARTDRLAGTCPTLLPES